MCRVFNSREKAFVFSEKLETKHGKRNCPQWLVVKLALDADLVLVLTGIIALFISGARSATAD